MSAESLWAKWYDLPQSTRAALVRKYGGEFAAAWSLFGGG